MLNLCGSEKSSTVITATRETLNTQKTKLIERICTFCKNDKEYKLLHPTAAVKKNFHGKRHHNDISKDTTTHHTSDNDKHTRDGTLISSTHDTDTEKQAAKSRRADDGKRITDPIPEDDKPITGPISTDEVNKSLTKKIR